MAIQDITNPITFLGGYITRFTAQLGLNSTPTTVDIELVPGSVLNSYDVSHNATGFDFIGAEPGKMSGFGFGAFNFIGIIQSWTENYGSQGLTYSVKLADPRIIFDGVQIVTGPGVVCTGLRFNNLINIFGAMNSPSGIGLSDDGSLYRPIRDYLSTTGIINVYNKRLSLIFGSGFRNSSGDLNPDGIPPWYQIKTNLITLNGFLSQAASDNGFDYYVNIVPSSWNPSNSVISPAVVKTIKRTAATGSNQISGYINNWVSSGILSSYKRGRELRTEANASILSGPPETAWFSCNTNNIYTYWGRAQEGSALFNASLPNSGMVLLDNITGSGVAQTLSSGVFRIQYQKHTISKTQSDVYPPRLSVGVSTQTMTGYYVNENVLRGALYSKESWESMLYAYQSGIAIALGITYQPFMDALDYGSKRKDVTLSSLNRINPSAFATRTPDKEALISAVYELTRQTADEHYGRAYIAQMDTSYSFFISEWLSNGRFSYDSGFPSVEYEVANSAWAEALGIPEGIINHEFLRTTDNSTFKDPNGNLKGFFSYRHYNNQSNSSFPYAIDMSVLDTNSYLIEQGNKLCVPVSAELYEKFPKYLIFQVPTLIQGLTGGRAGASGYSELAAFYDFLTVLGYDTNVIDCVNLMEYLGDNAKFGLVPPRPMAMASAGDNYGLNVPFTSKTCNFGPYLGSGIRPGPVNLNVQSDLNPTRFNGFTNLDTAGAQSVARSFSALDVIDFGDITLAGIPEYNLGDDLGDNSNITSISVQFGQDGLTTTYSLKTFALPSVRQSKLLLDRVNKNQNIINYTNKKVLDISDDIKKLQEGLQKTNVKINKPSDINAASLTNGTSTRLGNYYGGTSTNFLAGIYRRGDPSGNFIDC